MMVVGSSGEVSGTARLTLTVDSGIDLAVQPNVRTALPGDVAAYTVSVATSGDFAVPVSLSLQGKPSETDVSIDPNPVTPPGTSQLHITTTPDTLARVYSSTVIGTGGGVTESADLTLIVASAMPSFTLSVSPTARIAEPNQMVSYTMAITGANGFSDSVTLTVVGLPPGIVAAWSVNPVMPDSASVLTVSVPGKPLFGRHPLHVVGAAGAQVIAKEIELIVVYPFSFYLPIVLK